MDDYAKKIFEEVEKLQVRELRKMGATEEIINYVIKSNKEIREGGSVTKNQASLEVIHIEPLIK